MKDLREFNIPFVGLKEGSHLFEYQIDKKFFEAYNFDEFQDCTTIANVTLVKKSTLMELHFTTEGSVQVPCDLTNELYDQEISGSLDLVVKFGQEYNDENEEILILPQEAYQVNVAQYIYELIVLSVPTKRLHPDVVNGTIESDALKKLEELQIKENKTVANNTTDPRWDKLKNLLTDK